MKKQTGMDRYLLEQKKKRKQPPAPPAPPKPKEE